MFPQTFLDRQLAGGQNDSVKFQNHPDFVGIPEFCILIFKF